MSEYIKTRLKSRSTYIGLGLLASSAHYHYIAEVLEETLHIMSTLIGMIFVFIPKRPQVVISKKE